MTVRGMQAQKVECSDRWRHPRQLWPSSNDLGSYDVENMGGGEEARQSIRIVLRVKIYYKGPLVVVVGWGLYEWVLTKYVAWTVS